MKLIWGEDRSASVIHSSEPFFFDCSEKCDPLSELFSAAAPCASYSTPHTQKKRPLGFQRKACPIPHYPVILLRVEGHSAHLSERGAMNSCFLISLNELLLFEVTAILAT